VKGRQIEPLARKYLLPVLPGFTARGALVYRRPAHYLLHAVAFDTSAFTSSRIFVSAFVQPLYLPSDDLTRTYGFRLRNDFWDVDEANADASFSAIADEVRREALSFFEQVSDLDRFCALVPQWATEEPKKIMQNNSLDDPVVLEDLAYAAILRGNRDRAVELLEAAVASEQESGEYTDDELLASLESTLGLIERRGLEAAQAQLEEWYRRNLASLKLES
jgi:hypothetical protein